jgi:hypothetical protein
LRVAVVAPAVPNPVPTESVPSVAEAYLRNEESGLLQELSAAADAAADADDPSAELARLLEEAGVTACLPRVLSGLVDAVGRNLRATPVAAPPYVVVTSRGPVLRATLADGRLVVVLVLFDVSRGPTYERVDGVEIEASLR